MRARERVEIDRDCSLFPVYDMKTKQLEGVCVNGPTVRGGRGYLFLAVETIRPLICILDKYPVGDVARKAFAGTDIDLLTKVRLVPPGRDTMPKFIAALQTFTGRS